MVKTNRTIKTIGAFFFGIFCFGICISHAATLTLVPNHTSVLLDQPVRVDLSIDTGADTANALQGEIDFPITMFSLQSIRDGASPISFWIESPEETGSGTVSFSGIIPGGFQGSAKAVISLWLLPIAPGTGTVTLAMPQLLRNDGSGSSIAVSSTPATVAISSTVATSTPSQRVSLVSPDVFTPVVTQDPNLFGGQYFLVFSTTDKGSGIDHYEVLEVPTAKNAGASSPAWQTASSPYLLQDQSLSSNIFVRAVDRAGNFTVVEVPAEHPASGLPWGNSAFPGWAWIAIAILLAIILSFVVLAILRRRRRHRSQ